MLIDILVSAILIEMLMLLGLLAYIIIILMGGDDV